MSDIDPFEVDPSRKEGLNDAEIDAVRQMYEHFVGETYETDSGTVYEVTSARIKDGEPYMMLVPLTEAGEQMRMNKDEHHLAEFKRRFLE